MHQIRIERVTQLQHPAVVGVGTASDAKVTVRHASSILQINTRLNKYR